MIGKPRLSVIIPTYNRLAYLREALDTVVRQTVPPDQIIVVDDGSTEDIAGAIAEHPSRPIVLRQNRQGPAAARNLGLREADGEWVAFLDSDDLWLPTKIERSLEALRAANGPRIVYGPMSPVDSHARPVPGRTKPCFGGWITEPLFCSSFVHVPSVVCCRKLLRDEGGFDANLPVCEDYDLWLRISLKQPYILIEDPLALRRLHDRRLSKSDMSRNLAVKARMLHRFHDDLGGRQHIRPEVARKRLARVYFSAAREASRAGHYRDAFDFLNQARFFGASPSRTWPRLLAARVLSIGSRAADARIPRPNLAQRHPQAAE